MLNVVKYFNRSRRSILLNRSISTMDHEKIEMFSTWENFWWDENGPIKGLHQYVPVRTQLVKDGLVNAGVKLENSNLPLNGIKIVDVGCGGGIMTEALARIGAQVTGIDVSSVLIKIAKEHLKLNPDISKRVNYICTTVEDFAQKEGENSTYDAILIFDVLQYVPNKKLFLKDCVKIVKPGKSIFITTPNRTFISWLFIVVTAQYIVGSIPRGTLEWNRFITSHELQCILKDYCYETKSIRGIKFNPLTRKWTTWSKIYSCYGLHAIKQKEIYM